VLTQKYEHNDNLSSTDPINYNNINFTTAYPLASTGVASGYPSPEGVITLSPEINSLVASQSVTSKDGGTIIGELYSVTNNAHIPNTLFFLVDAVGEGNEVPSIITGPSEDDKLFYTNFSGEIYVIKFDPGYYYLIMAAPPYDWALGYKNTSDLTPYLIEVKNNEVSKLGRILIYWP